MKKITLLIVWFMTIMQIHTYSQNGLIGEGFGTNNWSTTDNFYESAGGTRIGIFTPNKTGNQYFRLVTNWGGNYNQWGPSSTSTDYSVTPNTEVLDTEIIENNTSKAYYINTSNTSDKYVFKTKSGGYPVGEKGLIVFRVQGDIRTISTVSQNPAMNSVHRAQDVVITATINESFNQGQGITFVILKMNMLILL